MLMLSLWCQLQHLQEACTRSHPRICPAEGSSTPEGASHPSETSNKCPTPISYQYASTVIIIESEGKVWSVSIHKVNWIMHFRGGKRKGERLGKEGRGEEKEGRGLGKERREEEKERERGGERKGE